MTYKISYDELKLLSKKGGDLLEPYFYEFLVSLKNGDYLKMFELFIENMSEQGLDGEDIIEEGIDEFEISEDIESYNDIRNFILEESLIDDPIIPDYPFKDNDLPVYELSFNPDGEGANVIIFFIKPGEGAYMVTTYTDGYPEEFKGQYESISYNFSNNELSFGEPLLIDEDF